MSFSKPSGVPLAFDDTIVTLRKEIITNRFRRLTSMSTMAKMLNIFYHQLHLVVPQNVHNIFYFFDHFDFDVIFEQMEFICVNPARQIEMDEICQFDQNLLDYCSIFEQNLEVLQQYLNTARGNFI